MSYHDTGLKCLDCNHRLLNGQMCYSSHNPALIGPWWELDPNTVIDPSKDILCEKCWGNRLMDSPWRDTFFLDGGNPIPLFDLEGGRVG